MRPTEELLPSPEERFGQLFKAARVLLKEGITDEDKIVPTLAYAARTGPDFDDSAGSYEPYLSPPMKVTGASETWELEVDRFVSFYRSLRPVRLIGEVLILERLPVDITLQEVSKTKTPQEVLIIVNSRGSPPKAEHVASLYDKELSDAHIPHDELHKGGMSFEFDRGYLAITITRAIFPVSSAKPGTLLETRAAAFPHPKIVQEFYQMLRKAPVGEGFANYLGARRRGGPPAADNLIPACVGFYLRYRGGIENRKEVHRLLNKYGLWETWKKTLPEVGTSDSPTNQLWRDIAYDNKVGKRLRAAEHTLMFPGE